MKKYEISGLEMHEIEADICGIPLANTINRFNRLINKLKSLGMKFKPVDSVFYSEKPINKYERIYDSKNDMYIYVKSVSTQRQAQQPNNPDGF